MKSKLLTMRKMELIKSSLFFAVFVFFGAQGFPFDDHLRIRTVKRNEGQDDCLTNVYNQMGVCMRGKVNYPPFNTTSDGTLVFTGDIFSRLCSLYTDISKCYTGLGSPDCDQPLPPFVKRSRDLGNLVCRHENEWTSLLRCMNKRTFQNAVTTLTNQGNLEVNDENLCSTANGKLNEFLRSTRTECGEESYTTIKTALSPDVFVIADSVGLHLYPERCGFQVDETPTSTL